MLKSFLNPNFLPDEKLYRAVYPPEIIAMYWKENGELSSAAFKDKKGLSVERGYYRSDSEVVENMLLFFSGLIYNLRVQDCIDVNAYTIWLPSSRSEFHTEIHGSKHQTMLTASQCKALARKAHYVCA